MAFSNLRILKSFSYRSCVRPLEPQLEQHDEAREELDMRLALEESGQDYWWSQLPPQVAKRLNLTSHRVEWDDEMERLLLDAARAGTDISPRDYPHAQRELLAPLGHRLRDAARRAVAAGERGAPRARGGSRPFRPRPGAPCCRGRRRGRSSHHTELR